MTWLKVKAKAFIYPVMLDGKEVGIYDTPELAAKRVAELARCGYTAIIVTRTLYTEGNRCTRRN